MPALSWAHMSSIVFSPLLLKHLFEHVPALSAAAVATISPITVNAGIWLRMLERTHAIPGYPSR